MHRISIATAAGLITFGASAQDAAEGYRARLTVSGYLLRAANACGGPQTKATIDTAMRYASSGNLVQFNRAFPKQSEAWLREGAGHFNEEVMAKGMTASCTAAYAMAKAAP